MAQLDRARYLARPDITGARPEDREIRPGLLGRVRRTRQREREPPASATLGLPMTGAARNCVPRAASSCLACRDASTETVDRSITMAGACSPAIRPAGPSRASSRFWDVPTMTKTTFACPRSAARSTIFAPSRLEATPIKWIPKPMVVVPGQVDQQKRKVTHIVDHRFQPPIIPKIAYGETSARLRLRNARA